jgi:putative oxidoreductase
MPVEYGLLVLRVAVGLVLLAHGIKHVRGRDKTTAWFASIGFRQPALQWFAVSATEIGVGILLVAGGLTSLAAAGAIAMMTVAFMSVHRYAGFWITARPDEGWEYVFTIAASALALAIAGPGSISVDDQLDLATKLDGWVGLGLAALGVLAAFGQLAVFYRPGDVAPGGINDASPRPETN